MVVSVADVQMGKAAYERNRILEEMRLRSMRRWAVSRRLDRRSGAKKGQIVWFIILAWL